MVRTLLLNMPGELTVVRQFLTKWLRSESGVAGPEYMLLISVVTVAIVAAGVMFVPTFQSGVSDLGTDVERILKTHKIGDPTDAKDQAEVKSQNVNISFDGMLENVGGAEKSAALIFLAFVIAGAMWAARNKGKLSAQRRADANAALAAYAANGGNEDEIRRAYNNIDARNGNVAAAWKYRRGGVVKGPYTPGDTPFKVIDSNGNQINKPGGGGGVQSA